MLATHVWRTHQVWAEEYRAYFGLSAKRGLVGTDTSAKLRAAATEYLVPHLMPRWNSLALQLAASHCGSAARGFAWRRGSTPPMEKRCAAAVAAAPRLCASG